MTKGLEKSDATITQRDYGAGVNVVIETGGRAASTAFVKQDGLIDVEADNGSKLYTGYDSSAAGKAVKEYLKGE